MSDDANQEQSQDMTPASPPPPAENGTEREPNEPSFPEIKFLLETYNAELWKGEKTPIEPDEKEIN
jgi:hypothetical protein